MGNQDSPLTKHTLQRPKTPSTCTGSRLPVLTRTGGKRILQRPKKGPAARRPECRLGTLAESALWPPGLTRQGGKRTLQRPKAAEEGKPTRLSSPLEWETVANSSGLPGASLWRDGRRAALPRVAVSLAMAQKSRWPTAPRSAFAVFPPAWTGNTCAGARG